MQQDDPGRRSRARLVAASVICALALSMLPVGDISAVPVVATRLNILGLPASAVVGQNIPFQVEAVDALGNRDTSFGGASQLLSLAGTSPACFTPLIGIVFSGGLATVSSFSCTAVGPATIIASTPGLAPAAATIQITSSKLLRFASYPTSPTPSLLNRQPRVQLRKRSGSLIKSPADQIIVTLTVSPTTISFSCSGGTSKQTIDGIAAFSGCTLPAGMGYRLTASAVSAPDVESVTGRSFSVVSGNVPASVVFSVQPLAATPGFIPTTTSGQVWGVQPQVTVHNGGNRRVTSDNKTVVTLSIGSGSSAGILTCPRGTSLTVNKGIASFIGCSITGAGSFTLRATATNPSVVSIAPATSLPFNLGQQSTGLTLTANPIPINVGQSSTLAVQFTGGANRQIQIQWKNALDPNYQTVVTLTTDSTGRAVYTTLPLTFSTTYQAVFAGGGGLAASASPSFVVGVRRTVTMAPRRSGYKSVAKGTKLTFMSRIGPLNGVAVPRGTFQIYQQVNGVWQFSTSATFACDSAGYAVFTWTFNHAGNWYVRWRANSDAYNVTGYSPIAKVQVH